MFVANWGILEGGLNILFRGRNVHQGRHFSHKGAPDTENPSCEGFTVLRGGFSDRALRPWSRPWGRGRYEFAKLTYSRIVDQLLNT